MIMKNKRNDGLQGGCLSKGWSGRLRPALWLALVWWVVAYAIFSTHVGWGMAPVDWRRLSVFGVPAVLLCYGLVAMERSGGSLLPRWLRSVGDSSYSIYLSHVLVISALGRLWGAVKVDNAWLNGLALAALFAGALIAGRVSYRVLELPLHNRTRRRLALPQALQARSAA